MAQPTGSCTLEDPKTFVGLEYDQMVATQVTVLRGDYAFELLRNFQVLGIGNVALGFRNKFLAPDYSTQNLWAMVPVSSTFPPSVRSV
jgi:hypothetical protein